MYNNFTIIIDYSTLSRCNDNCAFVRYNNTLTLYLNGTSVSTFNCTGITYGNVSSLTIGRNYTNHAGECLTGYVDEIRVSKGIARWTSS